MRWSVASEKIELERYMTKKDCVRVCTYCQHDVNVHIDSFNEQGERTSQRCMAGEGYHIGVPPVKDTKDSICECTRFEWDRTFVWIPPEQT